MNAAARLGKGLTLLATMLFLLVAASFHSAADNDLARCGSYGRVLSSNLSLPDTCAACTLDGLLTVRLTMTSPVALPTAAESVSISIPPSPFVSPRASVESRPPPSIA